MSTTDATTSATREGFLILHGWQNHRPADHWQHWLADRLVERGHEVRYPQLPDADDPDLEAWLAELRSGLEELAGAEVERRTVLCHSLACLLWLHGVERSVMSGLSAPVDRVLLVAPPSAAVLRENSEITAFRAPAVTGEQVSAVAGHTRFVASDNDPYCEPGAEKEYGLPLGLPVDVLPGTEHLNPDAGYGPWPRMLEWCLEDGDGSTGLRDRTGLHP